MATVIHSVQIFEPAHCVNIDHVELLYHASLVLKWFVVRIWNTSAKPIEIQTVDTANKY